MKTLLIALSLVAAVVHAAPASPPFLWGVANASFQVEGSPEPSDWLRWTHEPGRIADGTNADRATDFWNRSSEDFKLARQLGARAFRISIAWERVEPRHGEWNESALKHYSAMIQEMRHLGLEPIVTLHHFVLPTWVADAGGLTAPQFPMWFGEYAEKVVRRLSSSPTSVTWWMTFNEPMVLVNGAYITGEWPPGHKNDATGAMQAAAGMARAHLEAVRRIRALGDDRLKVSIAKHWRVFDSAPRDPMGWIVAKLSDWAFNRQFMDALMTGRLFFWMPGAKLIRDRIALPDGRPSLDYLGLNYYGRMQVSLSSHAPFFELHEGPGSKNDLGWEIYPQGLYKAFKAVERYHLPVLVSENGVADAQDRLRPDFLRAHLRELMRARQEGFPVIGYLHWSLTDNFEWAYGLKPRFGLVEVDYKTLARKPRPSFEEFRRLIQSDIEINKKPSGSPGENCPD